MKTNKQTKQNCINGGVKKKRKKKKKKKKRACGLYIYIYSDYS